MEEAERVLKSSNVQETRLNNIPQRWNIWFCLSTRVAFSLVALLFLHFIIPVYYEFSEL